MDRLGFYFWVIVVGFIGGVLSIAGGNAKIASDGKAIINFFVGTISSTFICWVAYETTFYFTEKGSFSLAVGGFFCVERHSLGQCCDRQSDKQKDG